MIIIEIWNVVRARAQKPKEPQKKRLKLVRLCKTSANSSQNQWKSIKLLGCPTWAFRCLRSIIIPYKVSSAHCGRDMKIVTFYRLSSSTLLFKKDGRRLSSTTPIHSPSTQSQFSLVRNDFSCVFVVFILRKEKKKHTTSSVESRKLLLSSRRKKNKIKNTKKNTQPRSDEMGLLWLMRNDEKKYQQNRRTRMRRK